MVKIDAYEEILKKNVWNITVAGWIVSLFFVVLDLALQGYPDSGTWKMTYMTVTFSISILFYKKIPRLVMAHLTCIYLITGYFISCIVFPEYNGMFTFTFLVFIFFVLILIPFHVFHIEKEKGLIAFYLLLMLLGQGGALFQIGSNNTDAVAGLLIPWLQNNPTLTIIYVSAVMFFIFIFYFNMLNLYKYQSTLISHSIEIQEAVDQIESQNEELKVQHEELLTLQEELQSTSDMLEQTVHIRTSQLEIQNKQLLGFGFMNAHLLRTPILRIKGLMPIAFSLEGTSKEIEFHINESIKELEGITQTINAVVEDKDPEFADSIRKKASNLYKSKNY